jgi:hypothetical protein
MMEQKMNGILADKVVAALRDTAAKVNETATIERTERNPMRSWEAQTVTDEVEKYSKDWIAGRLLGMADTIEALTALRDAEGNS